MSTTPYLQCIAVSTTSDATGTFNRYSFQYSNFDDYPKMGVWSDGYYETFNMFNGNTFVGADACAYNRTAMLAGSAATQVCFQQGSSVGGLLASDIDGTTAPPAGSPNYMVYFGTNNLNLFKFHVDFNTPANSTFTGPTVIPVAAFSPLCGGGTCVPQAGTTQQLDSLADRLMYRLAYRNFGTHESLVVNHSVTAGSSGGVRWYEIQNPSGTPTVAQQSTFAPDSNYRWMGSIAMDQAGDMAVGYSVASSSLNPTIRYTGRVPSDPSGTMEAEVNVVTGTGSQTTGLSRWGDYSAMQVDPVDDCTFWYTTEYIKTNGTFNWNTRIANFKFPTCGSSTPDFTIGASPSSLTIAQGSSGTSTITITSLNSFNSATTLSASGLPGGVTAAFSTNPVTPPANGSATSTLTLTASGTATTGNATVTVTGTSGALTHSTTIALTVTASGGGGLQTATYSSTFKAPSCGSVGSGCDSGPSLLLGRDTLSGGAEPNQPNTINNSCSDGTSGTFHSDESNDRLVIQTTDGSNLAPGKTVKVSATVWAYSGFSSDHLDLYYAANASSPSWVLIGTITPTAAGAQTLSANYTLPSGGSQAVRAQFRYLGSASSCSTGAYDDHDDLVFAVGAGTPGFTVAASPSAVSVARGSNVSSTITVTSVNGFNSATTLSLSALPSGVTAAFSANPVTPPANGSATSTLTFTASATATTGTTNVTVTGTSGSLVQTTTIALTVTAPSSQLIQNGGFETGTLANWTTGGVVAPTISTVQKHSGTYSALDGASSGSEPNGDDFLYQAITIPSTATKATLTFWYWPATTDTITYDWQEAQVQNTSGATLAQVMKVCSNAQAWTQVTYDLTSYKGQTIRIYFNDHQDGYGDLTYMYVDDVSVTVQ